MQLLRPRHRDAADAAESGRHRAARQSTGHAERGDGDAGLQPGEATNVQISLVQNPAGSQNIDLQWSDKSQPFKGIVPPGFYTVVIHIPGYADLTPEPFECKVGETCGPGNLTPSANPRFTGTLTLNPASPTSTPQIRVAPPGAGTVTVRYDAGALHWQEPGAPEDTITPGVYTVSVTLAGYGPIVDQPFKCEAGPSCRLDLAMIKPTNLTVIGTAAGGDPLGARFSLTVGSAAPQLTAGATANRVTFTSLTSGPPAALKIEAGGYQTINLNQNSAQVTCAANQVGLKLVPGDVTCTVTMKRIGRVPLLSRGVIANGFVALESTSVTAVQLTTPPVGGTPFSDVTRPGGIGLLIGSIEREGLNAGDWRITATRTGYLQTEGVITIDPVTYALVVKSGSPTTQFGPGLAVQSSGDLAVVLAPVPATPVVQLRTAAGDSVLPASTITLSDGTTAGACTLLPSAQSVCSPGDSATVGVDNTGTGVSAGAVRPASTRSGSPRAPVSSVRSLNRWWSPRATRSQASTSPSRPNGPPSRGSSSMAAGHPRQGRGVVARRRRPGGRRAGRRPATAAGHHRR